MQGRRGGVWVPLFLLIPFGCGGPRIVLDGSTDDSTAGDLTTEGTTGDTTDPDETGTDAGTTSDPAGSCGDGVLDAGEECDLGPNNADSAGCTSECRLGYCGDGLLLIGTEECDEAGETVDCNADCTIASCGDGIINATRDESCEGEVAHGDCLNCRYACDEGFENCNDDIADGCESNLATPTSCGACGVTCTTDEHCTADACRDKKLVFVTLPHDGNLGGMAGADAICAAEAKAGGLDGTFLAWISDGTPGSEPASRFSKLGPYFLPDGDLVAIDWADLTDGELAEPIDQRYNGNEIGGNDYVFTNVGADGTASSPDKDCNGWTSAVGVNAFGLSYRSDEDWTQFFDGGDCATPSRLYCFEQ